MEDSTSSMDDLPLPRSMRPFRSVAIVLSIAAGSAALALVHGGRETGVSTSPERRLSGEITWLDAGVGKCVTADGGDPRFSYLHAVGATSCKNTCISRSSCWGYSANQYGNCLLWNEEGLQGGGLNFGNAHCYLKILPETSTTSATTTTASNTTATTTTSTSSTTNTTSTTSTTATSTSVTSTNTTSTTLTTTTSTYTTSTTSTFTTTTSSTTTYTTSTSTTSSTSSGTKTTTTFTTTSTTNTSTTTASTTTTSATTSTSSVTETTTSSATTSTTTTATLTTPTVTTSSTTTTSMSTSTSSATETTTSSTATASTTSTATSSHTTTTTSTTLTATNTTTTDTTTVSTTTPYVAVAALVERVEELEDSLVTALGDNVTTITHRVDGLTLVATKLDEAEAAAQGSLRVPLEDSEAEVVVPASLFSSPDVSAERESMVLTITEVDLTTRDFTGDTSPSSDTSQSSEPEVQVASVVNVNLLTSAGRRVPVSDLVEPIKVVIPANYSTGLQCVFWDEGTSSWSTKGVELGTIGKGTVDCWSTHLTLFAAIVRGFVKTMTCSQATLLTAESIKEVGKGDWYFTLGALILWCVLAAFGLLMLVAAWVDKNRWTHGRSRDENLLIPLRDDEEDVEPLEEEPVEDPPQEDPPQEDPPQDGSDSDKRRRRGMCAGCLSVCGLCHLDWCKSSGALRDAADEVFSQWVTHFGEIRDLIEGLTEGLECSTPTGGHGFAVVNRILSKTLVMSARRQAAASLRISWDTSTLLTEQEEMNEVVRAHHSRHSLSNNISNNNVIDSKVIDNSHSNVNTNLNRASTTTLAREETWGELHRTMEVKLDTVMEDSGHWSALPGIVWRLFLHGNPINMCLVRCVFTSCKLRVLLFMVHVIGSLLLTTLFFTASGVPGKRSRNLECLSNYTPWEFVGRVIAIGSGSLLVAGVPGLILGSLCTRSVRKLDYEGCPQWKKQLRVWRTQDRVIWSLGSLYLAFCMFFIVLFLANVDEKDHPEWLLSGLLSVAESIVLIPLLMALVLPLLVTMCLNIMSSKRRVAKEDLVSELHLKFKSDAHMEVMVGRI